MRAAVEDEANRTLEALSTLVVAPQSLAAIEARLEQLIVETSARYALFTDGSGQLICARGETTGFDVEALAALVAANFAAARTIARMIDEPHFHAAFQQGERSHLLTALVGDRCVLSVGFDRKSRLGLVKLLSSHASADLATILEAQAAATADDGVADNQFKATASELIEVIFREANTRE